MLQITFLILLLFVIAVLIIWTYFNVSCGICKYSGHLVGKVVIVTGANSGIGLETAKDIAQRGARVILACRNLERGAKAQQEIIESSKNKDIHLLQLNLESFASIRKFVNNINQTEKRLDILINNAGIYTSNNSKTEDGLFKGLQVNYLGPFLLTSLLLPLIKKSAPSRIINVSSFMYAMGRIDFGNLEENSSLERPFTYADTKLCIVLMTTELARRLAGTRVTVNCLHPGAVSTSMIDKLETCFIRIILKALKSFLKNSWEGAQTTIYLAVSPEVENISGRYFKDCRLAVLSSKAQNLDIAKKLWDLSEKLVKL